MNETKYIWTDHALKRLKERKMTQTMITNALSFPDRKMHKDSRTIEFQKKVNKKTVAAIIKSNNQGENIIVSCWINPPFPGTKDFRQQNRYRQIKNTIGFKKLWFIILYKIGV